MKSHDRTITAEGIAKNALTMAYEYGVLSTDVFRLLSFTVRAAAENGLNFADSKNDSEAAAILAEAYAIVKRNA